MLGFITLFGYCVWDVTSYFKILLPWLPHPEEVTWTVSWNNPFSLKLLLQWYFITATGKEIKTVSKVHGMQPWEPESDPQNPCKKPRSAGMCQNSQHWEGRDRLIPGGPWQASLAYLVPGLPGQWERKKKKNAQQLRNNTECCPLASMWTHLHSHPQVHIQQHKHW